ncbi:hypothetical protein [Cerasicoccus frondis]|uniref:hypothetical protein n=1 Tax=Cerasicoccus frondis TaxID=490090 RepID=UPI0028529EB5|nr:hypothetical protein [Cerasicoccus frondis]
MRATVCLIGIVGLVSVVVHGQSYTSPYAITLDADIGSWTADISGRIDLVNAHSTPGTDDWYDYNSANWVGSSKEWGVSVPQLYSTDTPAHTLNLPTRQVINGGVIPSAPLGVDAVTYQQQRVISVASSLIGTPYQHHHNPTWNPYAHGYSSVQGAPNYWDWNPVSDTTPLNVSGGGTMPNPWLDEYGKGTAGIDCSNFASYIYNVALGIQMVSAVGALGDEEVGALTNNPIIAPDGEYIEPGFINGPNYVSGDTNAAGSLQGLIGMFRPGDLLFMFSHNEQDEVYISHVVMWLGIYGTLEDGSASDIPLVISSHDNLPAILDANGELAPPGVEILPFQEDTWFYTNFSHAMRVIDPTSVPEPEHYAMLVGFAGLALVIWRRRNRQG